MLTEKEIMPAANRYMAEIFNSGQRDNYFWADVDFANGATWALGRIDPLCADGAKMIEQLRAENERLSDVIARLTNHIEEMQSALEK